MKLHHEIEAAILLQNNSPIDDFLGLSPNQMNHLIYDAFGDNSPVQLRDDIDDATLDKIPLFRIVEEYLKIIQRDQQIKLTRLGALPRKVVVELYDKQLLPDELIESGLAKLMREANCISIWSARLAAEMAGLVRKANGKLTLTKTATKLLDTNNRLQTFKLFFRAYNGKFNWGSHDNYPEVYLLQLAWGFSVILLDKYGDQPEPVRFYATKFLKAFPHITMPFAGEYATPEQQFSHCYCFRTFEQFFLWFGFVTVDKRKMFIDTDKDKFTGTGLVKNIFVIDY